MRNLYYLFIFLFCCSAYSQSFSVFGVDTTSFPTMKAKFFAFDANGNQITNLSNSSFEVKENGQSRTVTNVSCPSLKPPTPLSSVLTVDISGSMEGSGLNFAKAASHAWINALPLGKSQCAVTSFDSKNYINQDFTTDKNKLVSAVTSLKSQGGTDYDYGLYKPLAGSLVISKAGKNKRIVVFVTDGQPNQEPQVSLIIAEANSQNCNIYSVVIGNNCPQNLKDISSQTGGQWFENINSEQDAIKAYQQILMTVQGSDLCEISWQSGVSCFAGITNVELRITSLGLTANLGYQSPNSSIAKLEFNPTTLKFLNAIPGIKRDTIIKVTARNSAYNVTNITSSNPAFTISPTSFSLPAGQSKDLKVSFTPFDSGYVFCKFTFENDKCQTIFYSSGGFPGKKPATRTLKLIKPNGGEVFVAGSDTIITWEGVSPEEKVTIEYRTDDSAPWIKLTDTATGLSYKLRVPKIASDKYLARVTAKSKYVVNDSLMVLIPAGTFQMGNTGTYTGYGNEKPVHSVTISRDFWMSKYEVTQKQYKDFTGLKPSYFTGDNLPVEQVRWYDAIDFCNKLSEKVGLEKCYTINMNGATHLCNTNVIVTCDWNANGYRLPTEAEWEYACKAGSTTDFYNGRLTNEYSTPLDSNLEKIGWYDGNEGSKTRDVGQKQANAFGLYDMSGNVWEWCWDWYSSTYYTNTAVTDTTGPAGGSFRVFRGGSWRDNAKGCRSSSRDYYAPDDRSRNIGFRIVRTN